MFNLFSNLGLCGIPENLIQALMDNGKKGFTVISNNAGKARKRHKIYKFFTNFNLNSSQELMTLAWDFYSKTAGLKE